MTRLGSIISAAMLCACSVATTQSLAQQSPPRPTEKPSVVAQKCLDDLSGFGQRMEKDGFWLSSYGYRWPYDIPLGGREPEASQDAFGIDSPRFQILALYNAAAVLGHRGNEGACQANLVELRDVYDKRIAQLRQAGIEPGQVISWRQRLILASQPVTQLGTAVGIGNITGTDVRNMKDDRLGSINGLVLDPKTGSITHVIVARGGFLGIGRDYIAVPWQQFRATPGLHALVLNVSQDSIEKAPKVESNIGPSAFDKLRPQIDQYWQQQAPG